MLLSIHHNRLKLEVETWLLVCVGSEYGYTMYNQKFWDEKCQGPSCESFQWCDPMEGSVRGTVRDIVRSASGFLHESWKSSTKK
jgi:hypothetical protein